MYAYFMAAACAASRLLLIFRMGREKKLYYPLGAFLVALAVWVLADELTNKALSGSWAVWVQRAVLLAVIAALIVVMAKDIRASKAAMQSDTVEDGEPLEADFDSEEAGADSPVDSDESKKSVSSGKTDEKN